VRAVIDAATRLLSPGGWLLLEIGGRQDELLAPEMADRGFSSILTWRDEDGDLRGICGQAATRRSDASVHR
jgi:methylase of polypeptide subunit release factors